MRIITLLLLLAIPMPAFNQSSLNLDLFAQYDRGDERYSGSWVYVDAAGSEYALLGAKTGTAIYAIDEAPLEELAFIPGPSSNWREITVIGDHAFVTTEGSGAGSGMQVIDLSNLPASASLLTTYDETFTRGHIIQRDIYSPDPYVYVIGTSSTSGIHILDVSDPANPVEVGLYAPGYYLHDCHVKGDRLFAAAFYEGAMDVVDISDKSNPQLVAKIDDPGGNTHSSWLTEDDRFLFICDELDGLPARMFNIEDINDPYEVATYTANASSLVHNPYIRGDYIFITHNTEGLRVVDVHDPEIPVEVAYFDTYSGPSGGFHGLWSACPFLPSGKIVGGNREDGLYVWSFNDARAGRIYGKVVDSLSGDPIFGANIEVPEANDSFSTDFGGNFKTGYLPGDYSLEISAAGYPSNKTINVELKAEDSLYFEVRLAPEIINSISTPPSPSLTIYPNPTSGPVWVKLENAPPGKYYIIWYDANGRQLEVGTSDGCQLEVDSDGRQREGDTSAGMSVYRVVTAAGVTIPSGSVVSTGRWPPGVTA
jgi:choice-of-anchor B domain-containing protein